MNLLLDTRVLLWWLADDPKLSEAARKAIADPENTVFLSAVVIWEIRIKQGIGKLVLPENFSQVLKRQGFSELPISLRHADEVASLAPVHKDPFERLLVAQARVEKMTIITRDSFIADYGIDIVPA